MRKSLFSFDSLAKRVMVPALALVLAALAGLGAAMIYQATTASRIAADTSQVGTIDFVAKVSSPYIANYDQTSLETFSKELGKRSDIGYAEFFSGDGKTMAATGSAAAAGLRMLEREIADEAGAKIGTVKIAFNETELDQTRTRGIITVAVAILCAVLLIGAGLTLVVARVVRAAHEVEAALEDLALGEADLTARIPVHSSDEIGRIATAFNQFIGKLSALVGSVRDCAESLTASSHQVSGCAAEMADASREQNEASAAMATSVEAVTHSNRCASESAESVRAISHEGMELARQGSESVSSLEKEVAKIDSSVQNIRTAIEEFVNSTAAIAGLTGQVKDIADQTNLLALNAAIEAARAGEQGRGFAVVADEVRKLAEKSAQAASQINDVTAVLGRQSEVVQGALDSGNKSIEVSRSFMATVGQDLREAARAVSQADDGVVAISTAVRDQAAAAASIASNVERINRVSGNSSRTVARTQSAVHTLDELADSLTGLVGRFRV